MTPEIKAWIEVLLNVVEAKPYSDIYSLVALLESQDKEIESLKETKDE